MTDIIAKTIAYSEASPAPWLWTVETRSPCMTHQEILRHRRIITEEGLSVLGLGWEPDFSYSVSSTRAVPFRKMLEECRNPKLAAAPIHWGRAQGGMVPGEEIDDIEKCIDWAKVLDQLGLNAWIGRSEWITRREAAKRIWSWHGKVSARMAEVMVEVADPHKSIPNRMMQPHLHYNVLMTGTEPGWMNFMGLRLDGAADPIVRALAEQCWRELNESQPKKLTPGVWHLPYADDDQSMEEARAFSGYSYAPGGAYMPAMDTDMMLNTLQKMSVARCAHLSYTSFETGERMSVEKCLDLHRRLVGGVPIHASPAEHQATPDRPNVFKGPEIGAAPIEPIQWANDDLAGNLGPGWIQLRKLLPNEAVAPLPEAYR